MEKSERFIIDERTGLKYELCGDYYLIAGDDEPKQDPIGIWGMRRLKYIKNHRRAFYSKLCAMFELQDYLRQVDKEAEDMFNLLIKQMAEKQGITEQLKATDQMLWVGKMNNIRGYALEIVYTELINA